MANTNLAFLKGRMLENIYFSQKISEICRKGRKIIDFVDYIFPRKEPYVLIKILLPILVRLDSIRNRSKAI